MSTVARVRRPFLISVLVVLGIIGGIAGVITGIYMIADRESVDLVDNTGWSSDQLVGAGIAAIVIGAIYILVSGALWAGRRWARVVAAVVAVLNGAGGLWVLVTGDGESRASGAFTLVISLVVLWILFSHHAEQWFEQESRL